MHRVYIVHSYLSVPHDGLGYPTIADNFREVGLQRKNCKAPPGLEHYLPHKLVTAFQGPSSRVLKINP